MNLPHKTSFHRESDTLFRCSKAPDSAPEIAPGRFWCKKECFSAPKITFSRKWCQNEAFSAPKPPASRKQKNQLFSWFFVRAKGLEPPRRKTLDPKSSAATNYATPAFRIGTAKVGIFSQNANFLYLWRNPGNNVWKYSN